MVEGESMTEPPADVSDEIDMVFRVIEFMQSNAAAITENRWDGLKDEWERVING